MRTIKYRSFFSGQSSICLQEAYLLALQISYIGHDCLQIILHVFFGKGYGSLNDSFKLFRIVPEFMFGGYFEVDECIKWHDDGVFPLDITLTENLSYTFGGVSAKTYLI